MTHPFHHAQNSARRYGGKPEDYQRIHDWFDETKEMFADFRHRALRHHSHGIFECERIFGTTLINSNGTKVPVRYIVEQHIKEDCRGYIPTVSDWLGKIKPELWMSKSYELKE